MSNTEKFFISYEQIHKLVKKLALDIKESGWEPDLIVAIASGGFIPARILKTFLSKDIYVVGLKRYTDDKEIYDTPVKIQWIDEVEKKITGKKVLLVDEVDDTRVTLSYCLYELLRHAPEEIRVAVLHQKMKQKKGIFPPEIKHIYEAEKIFDTWIKYPWESKDIDLHNQGKE
jgi:hypoxanthine phosphoribosyltransferase